MRDLFIIMVHPKPRIHIFKTTANNKKKSQERGRLKVNMACIRFIYILLMYMREVEIYIFNFI